MRYVQTKPILAIIVSLTALAAAGRWAEQPTASAQRADAATSVDVKMPNREGSVRFAAVGDTGTGGSDQRRVAEKLVAVRAQFPYDFVIMMGDNLYGSESPKDYENKFAIPYKPLLDAGVKFYASLGNHDDTNQIMYKPFNMDGKRFYSFRPKLGSRFFALDSNYMSPEQLDWLQKELSASGSDWKIAFFHHPIYSSGARHGSDLKLRETLEPLFVKHGVDVVFMGHEHFYERLKPQKDIHYFVVGGSAKLRRGDIQQGPIHAKGYDQGYSFMLVEISDDEMHFQVISDQGKTVDSGTLSRVNDTKADAGATRPPAP
jgi:3',5'-cyclic AMP phosphodiesterase CpdA